jgi:hypothetical protein
MLANLGVLMLLLQKHPQQQSDLVLHIAHAEHRDPYCLPTRTHAIAVYCYVSASDISACCDLP